MFGCVGASRGLTIKGNTVRFRVAESETFNVLLKKDQMLASLKSSNHLTYFTDSREEVAPLNEAVAHVSNQDYPVELYGRAVGFRAFRITTSQEDTLLEDDWTIQFGWHSEQRCFHFSIWKWTSTGVLAMPRRTCERADFENAIEELVHQMADGSLDFDSE